MTTTKEHLPAELGFHLDIDDANRFAGLTDQLLTRLDEHKVLTVRSAMPLTLGAMDALADTLGATRPSRPGPNAIAGHEYLASLRTPGHADARPTDHVAYQTLLHHDSAAAFLPYVMLHTRLVPPTPPMTFVDTNALYESLPPRLRSKVDGRVASHGRLPRPTQALDEAAPFDAATATDRPLVAEHPRTGRAHLVIPRHPGSRIEGMSPNEAAATVAELWAFASSTSARIEVDMQPNDLVIWDNLAVLHTNPIPVPVSDREVWFGIVGRPLTLTEHPAGY